MPAAVVRETGRRLAREQPHRLKPRKRLVDRLRQRRGKFLGDGRQLRRVFGRNVEENLLVGAKFRAVVRVRRREQKLSREQGHAGARTASATGSAIVGVMAMMSTDAITNRCPVSSSKRQRAGEEIGDLAACRRGARRIPGEPERLIGRDAHARGAGFVGQ